MSTDVSYNNPLEAESSIVLKIVFGCLYVIALIMFVAVNLDFFLDLGVMFKGVEKQTQVISKYQRDFTYPCQATEHGSEDVCHTPLYQLQLGFVENGLVMPNQVIDGIEVREGEWNSVHEGDRLDVMVSESAQGRKVIKDYFYQRSGVMIVMSLFIAVFTAVMIFSVFRSKTVEE